MDSFVASGFDEALLGGNPFRRAITLSVERGETVMFMRGTVVLFAGLFALLVPRAPGPVESGPETPPPPGSWVFVNGRTRGEGETAPGAFLFGISPVLLDQGAPRRVITAAFVSLSSEHSVGQIGMVVPYESREIVQLGLHPSYEFAPKTGSWGTVAREDDVAVTISP